MTTLDREIVFLGHRKPLPNQGPAFGLSRSSNVSRRQFRSAPQGAGRVVLPFLLPRRVSFQAWADPPLFSRLASPAGLNLPAAAGFPSLLDTGSRRVSLLP